MPGRWGTLAKTILCDHTYHFRHRTKSNTQARVWKYAQLNDVTQPWMQNILGFFYNQILFGPSEQYNLVTAQSPTEKSARQPQASVFLGDGDVAAGFKSNTTPCSTTAQLPIQMSPIEIPPYFFFLKNALYLELYLYYEWVKGENQDTIWKTDHTSEMKRNVNGRETGHR